MGTAPNALVYSVQAVRLSRVFRAFKLQPHQLLLVEFGEPCGDLAFHVRPRPLPQDALDFFFRFNPYVLPHFPNQRGNVGRRIRELSGVTQVLNGFRPARRSPIGIRDALNDIARCRIVLFL
jgi:hypothetical protein